MPYFDWNATAPLHPLASEAWLEASETAWANPSTAYRAGVRARARLEAAREEFAGFLGLNPDQVVFTSGATEANNAAVRELMSAAPGKEVWISSIEHPSVREAALGLSEKHTVRLIPVDGQGRLDLDWVSDRLCTGTPGLVSVIAAHNETGVVQPWQEVRDLCLDAGVPFHCDAVQWVGKIAEPLCPDCAAVSLSGHKFGGPKGVGCLILGREWSGLKVLRGGGQEMDSRAGTENIASIVGMVAALKARMDRPPAPDQLRARDHFEQMLEAEWGSDIQIHGKGVERLWNTCFVSLPNHRANRWIAQLDRLGVEVSTGSACSAIKSGPSSALGFMGIDKETEARTIRISSGWDTRQSDWDELFDALKQVRLILDSEPERTGPGRVIEI